MVDDRARIDLTKYRERFQERYPGRDYATWVKNLVDETLYTEGGSA